jgi:hypothetical protein
LCDLGDNITNSGIEFVLNCVYFWYLVLISSGTYYLSKLFTFGDSKGFVSVCDLIKKSLFKYRVVLLGFDKGTNVLGQGRLTRDNRVRVVFFLKVVIFSDIVF